MNQADSPKTLSDMIGQEKIKENLSIQIAAARKQGDALAHLLFCGPPGSGKSTFAQVVANEMGIPVNPGPLAVSIEADNQVGVFWGTGRSRVRGDAVHFFAGPATHLWRADVHSSVTSGEVLDGVVILDLKFWFHVSFSPSGYGRVTNVLRER